VNDTLSKTHSTARGVQSGCQQQKAVNGIIKETVLIARASKSNGEKIIKEKN
jgi:hypothetical protein